MCEFEGCESEDIVLKTGLCGGHVQFFKDNGWRFLKSGVRIKDGVKVTPRGNVTVQAHYNPRIMALMAGEIEPADLDDDELARGMCRNTNGTWPKRVNMVPKAMYDRMTKELFQRSDEKLRDGLVDAVEAITKMMVDPDVDASTRLKAGTWLFERLRGKVPDVVQLTQDKPFEQVLTHIHRGPRPSETSGMEDVAEPAMHGSPTRIRSTGRHQAATPGVDRVLRKR